MQRHKLGTYAAGVAGMKAMCDLLEVGADPVSEYQEYSEIVGRDLTGAPIEAGFPQATWHWDTLPQEDFQYLLNFVGTTGAASVYVRTRKNSGASGLDFDDFLAVMTRPTGTREGLLLRDVTVQFLEMVAQ